MVSASTSGDRAGCQGCQRWPSASFSGRRRERGCGRGRERGPGFGAGGGRSGTGPVIDEGRERRRPAPLLGLLERAAPRRLLLLAPSLRLRPGLGVGAGPLLLHAQEAAVER